MSSLSLHLECLVRCVEQYCTGPSESLWAGPVDSHSTRAVAYLPSAWTTDVSEVLSQSKHTVRELESTAFNCGEFRTQLVLERSSVLTKHLLHPLLH